MNEQEWNPGQLLELSGYYWKTCTLHAGVKLDVFTAIDDQWMTAEALAEKISGDTDAVSRLCDALVSMELLAKSGETYGNTPSGKTFLSRTSPKYIGFMIMHHHHLLPSWTNLDQGVLSGGPVRSRASFSDEQTRESFLMGMFNIATNSAPRIVPHIDLSGKKHFLDLGGGPGTYAIHFCRQNPELRATVFDLPTTEPFARKTIARFDLSDRIDFAPGDFLEDAIPGTYDVAWLSHVLHGERPEDCRKMLGKVAAALEPGGLIIIHEFILNNQKDGPVFPALFSLNMLLGTDGGRAYSEAELGEMLSEAGASDIRRIPVDTPNDSGIMLGRV